MSNRGSQVRSRLALVGLILAFLLPAHAGAEVPTIESHVGGACPSKAQVDRALAAALADHPGARESGPYRLLIQHLKGDELQASLLDDGGTVVVERVLASSDCASLAEAIAIVVRAHFLQLGLKEREQALADADDNSPVDESPPAKDVPLQTEEVEGAAESSEDRLDEARSPSDSGNRVRWLLSAGVNGDLFLPDGELSPGGNLGVGLSWTHVRARLQGFGALPYFVGSGEDEIQRTPAGLLFGVSYLTSGRVRWEAGVSAGAGMSWLIPTNTSAPRRGSVVSPLLGGELRLLLQAAKRWRPWLGSYARYGLIREEYAVSPRGIVGQGPNLVLGLTLGLDLVLSHPR